MKIWIFRTGYRYGPYSVPSLKSFLEQGLVSTQDWAWAPGFGLEEWKPLEEILRMQDSESALQGVESTGLSPEQVDENAAKVRELVEKGKLELAHDLVSGLKDPLLYSGLLKGCSINDRAVLHSGDWKPAHLPFVLDLMANCPPDADLDESLRRDELSVINFPQNESIEHLHSLASFSKLQKIGLTGSSALRDLGGIRSLELESLILQSCESLEDFEPISSIKSLGTLSLEGCVGIRSLEFLEGLENLETLSLSKTGLSIDPDELGKLQSL